MNLLFSLNRNYIPTFLNCLKSIEERGGARHYSIHILHSDLNREDQERIRRSTGCSDFQFYNIDPAIFEGFPEFKRYPKEIYYRIIASLVLPDHIQRILYLDADIIVINPLTELYEQDFEDKWFVACTHSDQFLQLVNQLRLGVVRSVPYINTGVILYNLKRLRGKIDLDEIRDYTQSRKLTFILPDQDIFFGLYGEHIKLVDTMIYNLSDRILFFHNSDPANIPVDLEWVRKNSVIIHYCGRNKPWKTNYHGLLGIFYYELNPRLAEPVPATAVVENNLNSPE